VVGGRPVRKVRIRHLGGRDRSGGTPSDRALKGEPMHGSAVLGWLLAALTGAAALSCVLRLCAARRPSHGEEGCSGHSAHGGPGRESDAAEALMGIGMAVMALPVAHGGSVPAAAWAAVFGGVGGGFLVAALRRGATRLHRAHRLHHAVGAGAMAYMALAAAAGTAAGSGAEHAGHRAVNGGLPLLTGLLLLYFGGYALWTGSRLVTASAVGPGLAPAVGGDGPRDHGGGGGHGSKGGHGGRQDHGGVGPAATVPLRRAAGLAESCRLVMGLGMFAMLLAG
jgi:hypothetical protein